MAARVDCLPIDLFYGLAPWFRSHCMLIIRGQVPIILPIIGSGSNYFGSGSNYCFSVFEWHVHAAAGRSPLTAYGNARVGPPAMSFVRSMFLPTAFMRLKKQATKTQLH
jgi:hypothetical protein